MSVAASIPPLVLVPPLLDPPELLVFGAGGGGPAPGGIGFCEGASEGWNAFELERFFFEEDSSSSSDPHATRSEKAKPTPKMAAVAARDPRPESDIERRLSDARAKTEDAASGTAGQTLNRTMSVGSCERGAHPARA